MRLLLVLVFIGSTMGCGVRGRPLPPKEPPYIGDGNPPQTQMEDPNMPPPLYGDDKGDDDESDEKAE